MTTQWTQGGMFDGPEPAPPTTDGDDDLERWLEAPPVVGTCGRCGVTLLPAEVGDCDDCRREAMVRRSERTAVAYDKGVKAAAKKPAPSVGKPTWTDNAGEAPDVAAMPTAMRQAFARQLKRHGEATLYCATCRLPSGRFDVCYPCKMNPGRTPGRCDVCGEACRPEYATCWDCKNG